MAVVTPAAANTKTTTAATRSSLLFRDRPGSIGVLLLAHLPVPLVDTTFRPWQATSWDLENGHSLTGALLR